MGGPSLRQTVEETSSVLEENEPQAIPTIPATRPEWSPEAARKVIRGLLICDALMVAAISMQTAPLTALYERLICSQYYNIPILSSSNAAGSFCKAEPIQHELALIKGWTEALSQIPGIFLALPFGIAIDRLGRRPFLVLFVMGLFAGDTWRKLVCLGHDYLPLRLVWLRTLFEAIGGGVPVGCSIMFTIVADVLPKDKRVAAFMGLTAVDLSFQTIATAFAALTMKINLWIPLGLSSILWLAAIAVTYNMPETHPQRDSMCSSNPAAPSEELNAEKSAPTSMSDKLLNLVQSYSVITHNPVIMSMVAMQLITQYYWQSWDLLLQYTSKYYSWDYSSASMLIAVRGVVALCLTLYLVPRANTYWARRIGASTVVRDLRFAQLSGLLSCTGFMLLGLAFQPWISILGVLVATLGSSVLDFVQGVLSTLLPPTAIGSLYTMIALVRSVGGLFAGPLLAESFSWGMRLGGLWRGLPFILGSIFFGLIFLTLLIVPSSVIRSSRTWDGECEHRTDDEATRLLLDPAPSPQLH